MCDVCTLDDNFNNEYVKHLLEGKRFPVTFAIYITQSQSVANIQILTFRLVVLFLK